MSYLESVDSIVTKYSSAETVNLSGLRPEARDHAIALLSTTSDSDPESPETQGAIDRLTSSIIELASSLLKEKGVTVNDDLPKDSGVGANVLFRTYDQNSIAADAKYRYKTRTIIGTVKDIGRDIVGNPYVVLGDNRISGGVQCIFATEDEAEIAKLKKWQAVAVRGEVQGLILFNVLIKNCEFVEIPPKPTPVRQAIAVANNIKGAPATVPATAAAQNPPLDLERFVKAYIQSGASNSESAILEVSFYAEQVHYFNHGIVDRAFIAKDVRDYAKRWPNRALAIDGGIDFVMINPRTMRATFNTTYNASDGEKDRSGRRRKHSADRSHWPQAEIVSVKSKTISRRELVAS